jgi:dTDP-4-amino-4,6-dideoxygalactose transaminase
MHNDKGFKSPITVGQGYAPDDKALEDILRRIYHNKYYTNHGPLATEFESSLSAYLNVNNAIVSTNATLALVMTLVALDVTGTAVVPAICPPGVVEAVIWAGLTPVFCDVDPDTGHMTADTVKDAIRADTHVVIPVSLWGNMCEAADIYDIFGSSDLNIIHYADGAFGVMHGGKVLGCDSDASIFSFDSHNILSTTGGGCTATNNPLLARRIRNIRSSYGAGPSESVPVTANGRFSEYQAALGLWSLSQLEIHRAQNKSVIEIYKQSLKHIEEIHFIETKSHIISNYQDAVLIIQDSKSGITRNRIRSILEVNNIITSGKCHAYFDNTDIFSRFANDSAFPNMIYLSNTLLHLPVGAKVTPDVAGKVSRLVTSFFE